MPTQDHSKFDASVFLLRCYFLSPQAGKRNFILGHPPWLSRSFRVRSSRGFAESRAKCPSNCFGRYAQNESERNRERKERRGEEGAMEGRKEGRKGWSDSEGRVPKCEERTRVEERSGGENKIEMAPRRGRGQRRDGSRSSKMRPKFELGGRRIMA